MNPARAASGVSSRRLLASLALAQFICSYAGSNMNVMINDISKDLNTTVEGVQATITAMLLTMATLMIPGGKLTDRWGRKRCFMWGLALFGSGALLSALSPGLGVLLLGNSVLEGVGTCLLIPPVYILTTMAFDDGELEVVGALRPCRRATLAWAATELARACARGGFMEAVDRSRWQHNELGPNP